MFAIDTPNALFAVMPKRARFSRSRGVLFCASHESAAWTSSCRVPCVSFGDNWVGVLFIAVFVAVFATLVVFFFFVAGMRVLCEHYASGAHSSASRS